MEFPSSTPNPAILDAPLRGHGGMWAGFCEAHKGNAVPNMGTWLTPEAKAKYGKRRAKV
jgi:hypothetical protein